MTYANSIYEYLNGSRINHDRFKSFLSNRTTLIITLYASTADDDY